MSLYGSIQLANNALRAQQIGIQVVGQNIANVNTPGYIREEVLFEPAPTQRVGDLLFGMGVQVTGIVQKIDEFLEARLRDATSDRANSEMQEKTYLQLEAIIGELSDTDLSTSLNNFFASIAEVLNQPESAAVRNLAVLEGQTLAQDIGRLSARTRELRFDVNQQIISLATDVNRLVGEIHRLNVQIVATEGGRTSASDAVGLRDQRGRALAQLAELIDIRTSEQPSGVMNVFVGGDFLVFEGSVRQVGVTLDTDKGLSLAEIRVLETDAPIPLSSGKLAGLIASRDDILGNYLEQLDQFAATLAFEFNRIYSSGQGLKGFQQLTSEFAVDSTNAALDAAGLPFTPVNGSFQVLIHNKQTGLTVTTDVKVDLDGLDDDTSLSGLAAALNAINGLTAAVTPDRKLSIKSDSPDQQFAFANDTSGILAALGLNTFFRGTTAQTLGVSANLRADPTLFAASKSGIGVDSNNAVELAAFLDRPLASQNGTTLTDVYDRLIGDTTQGAAVTRAVADGFRVFEETLRGEQLAISGVSLDEEAVRLISFQRAFQAAARYIATVNDLLGILVNL